MLYRSPPSQTRGITLLEVTIAMFVLAIGLLGAASLLSVGQIELNEAIRVDATATLGRQALRDIETQGWLRMFPIKPANGIGVAGFTNNWLRAGSGSSTSTPILWPTQTQPLPVFPSVPVVLDPLMDAAKQLNPGGVGNITTFPFNAPSAFRNIVPQRITLRQNPGVAINSTQTAATMTPGAAERLFRSSDDISFVVPSEKNRLPIVQRLYSKAVSGTATFNATTSSRFYTSQSSNGDFSWFAVITVDPLQLTAGNAGSSGGSTTSQFSPGGSLNYISYNVAVCSVANRKLTTPATGTAVTPGERLATINFAPSGGAARGQGQINSNYAGEATLSAPPSTVNADTVRDYLRVQPEQWIIVLLDQTSTARFAYGLPPAALSTGSLITPMFYRVVSAAGDVTPSPPGATSTRSVRLVGPDFAVLQTGGNFTAQCIIVDGLYGVYQRTVLVDSTSPWLSNN